MSENSNIFFLYRHIRQDKDEPFYIGVGRALKGKSSFKSKYQRAFSKRGRNEFWWDIVKVTSYEIEILYECHSDEFISKKEAEFISLYGRIDLGTGTLCNLKEGGYKDKSISEITRAKISSGNLGKRHSIEARRKISISQIGKKMSLESRNKMSKTKKGKIPYNLTTLSAIKRKKPVAKIDSNGKILDCFDSIMSAQLDTKIDRSDIGRCCKGRLKKAGGYKWEYISKDFYLNYINANK